MFLKSRKLAQSESPITFASFLNQELQINCYDLGIELQFKCEIGSVLCKGYK